MAAFSDMESAEARAKVLMSTGAAIVAHSQQDKDGTISVRVLRPMTADTLDGQDSVDGMNKAGAWDVLTDDEAT